MWRWAVSIYPNSRIKSNCINWWYTGSNFFLWRESCNFCFSSFYHVQWDEKKSCGTYWSRDWDCWLKCKCGFPDKGSKWERYSFNLYSLQSAHPMNEMSNSANSRVLLINVFVQEGSCSSGTPCIFVAAVSAEHWSASSRNKLLQATLVTSSEFTESTIWTNFSWANLWSEVVLSLFPRQVKLYFSLVWKPLFCFVKK